MRHTHDVQVEGGALAIALCVEADTGVVPCTLSAHSLESEALVAYDHSLADVVAQQSPLAKTYSY